MSAVMGKIAMPRLARARSAAAMRLSTHRVVLAAPAVAIPATDARWVLAVRTETLLQGGRAALLTPEHRRGILRLAGHIGLRPFDASLVIAIVQDSVRSGQESLGPSTTDRLALIRPAVHEPALPPAMFLGISAVLALVMWAGIVAWFGA